MTRNKTETHIYLISQCLLTPGSADVAPLRSATRLNPNVVEDAKRPRQRAADYDPLIVRRLRASQQADQVVAHFGE